MNFRSHAETSKKIAPNQRSAVKVLELSESEGSDVAGSPKEVPIPQRPKRKRKTTITVLDDDSDSVASKKLSDASYNPDDEEGVAPTKRNFKRGGQGFADWFTDDAVRTISF